MLFRALAHRSYRSLGPDDASLPSEYVLCYSKVCKWISKSVKCKIPLSELPCGGLFTFFPPFFRYFFSSSHFLFPLMFHMFSLFHIYFLNCFFSGFFFLSYLSSSSHSLFFHIIWFPLPCLASLVFHLFLSICLHFSSPFWPSDASHRPLILYFHPFYPIFSWLYELRDD